MKIIKTIFTAAVLMAAVCLPAQNKSAGINLSLWKDICTQPYDSTQTTYVNLGLLSTLNRLNGVGINALGSVIHGDINGVQITGLANLAGGTMRGVQIRRVLTPGQEEHHRPESSAAKLYCLHLQEQECKKQEREKNETPSLLRRIILRLGRVTP